MDFDLGTDPATPGRDARVAIAMRIATMIDHVGVAGAELFLENCSRYCDWAQVDRDGWSELSELYDAATPDERASMLRVCRALPRPRPGPGPLRRPA